jgi:heat shock protein HslJ
VARAVLVVGLGIALAIGVIVIAVVSAGGDGARTGTSLVGTEWQWQALVGGDGSAIAPGDPSSYTIEFADDGSVAIRADCNRGTGSYSATAGSLTIEVGGVTRALCSEGSLSDRYLRDLGFVRTYVIEDGTLHLNLLADAGNLVHTAA